MAASAIHVNGIPYPLLAESLRLNHELVGSRERSESFAPTTLVTPRRVRRAWEIETPPRPFAEAMFLRDVACGLGDVWTYGVHAYSARGTPSTAPNAYSITHALFGLGRSLQLTAAQTIVIDDALGTTQPEAGLTAFVWVYKSSWLLHCLGWKYGENGAPTYVSQTDTTGAASAAAVDLTWSRASGLDLTATCAGTNWVQLLWLIPRAINYIAAATKLDWLSYMAQTSNAWGLSPRVFVSGEAVDPSVWSTTEVGATCYGEQTSGDIRAVFDAGTISTSHHTLGLKFSER